jgi:hypothetical protein
MTGWWVPSSSPTIAVGYWDQNRFKLVLFTATFGAGMPLTGRCTMRSQSIRLEDGGCLMLGSAA